MATVHDCPQRTLAPGCRGKKRTPEQQTWHQNNAPGNPVVRHSGHLPGTAVGGKTGADQTGAEINIGTDRDHPREELTVTGSHRPEVHAMTARHLLPEPDHSFGLSVLRDRNAGGAAV